MIVSTTVSSPLGPIHLAAENGALIGLWLEGQKYFAATLKEPPLRADDDKALLAAKDWLGAYFSGERPPISTLHLAPRGSEFRREVWKLLCEIPYGELTTYGALAKTLAGRRGLATMSSQAVGGAVGHNPISIIIPCHRVVGADGSLTGYAGGLDKKIALLTLEGVDMDALYRPIRGTAL